MANLQKALNALKPYVISIRYVEDLVVVDTIFKTGWNLIESSTIKRIKGEDETLNYYMIFSDNPNIGLDELLDYVSNVIKINLDREKKHDLLRAKVNELKEVFKKHTLSQLSRLKFIIADEELVPTLNEFDIDDEIDDALPQQINQPVEEQVFTSPGVPAVEYDQQVMQHQQQPLTEEEREMLEEEARAENFRRKREAEKLNGKVKPKMNVELPPRRKISEAIIANTLMPDCECGPDEACEKCIDSKGF